MDRIDRKILDILQKDARAPLKEIADRVFLSSPAVSARMAKLESSGAIMNYQAQVAAPMLGYMVKAFINLDMDPQRKPEFYPYIEDCPHVVECNCVTGDYRLKCCLPPHRSWTSSSTTYSSLGAPARRSCSPRRWSIAACRSAWRTTTPNIRNNCRPGGCSGFPVPWIRQGLRPRGAYRPRGCGPHAPADGAYLKCGSARSE